MIQQIVVQMVFNICFVARNSLSEVHLTCLDIPGFGYVRVSEVQWRRRAHLIVDGDGSREGSWCSVEEGCYLVGVHEAPGIRKANTKVVGHRVLHERPL